MGDSESLPNLLQTLEDACNSIDNPRSRQAAETVLNTFKASPQLLPKCQYLLEHTQQPMLQFQVASAIQEAIVREYSEYQESDVSVFAGWLVHYCIHHISLQRYIRDAVLRAAAVAFKRLSLSLSFNITPHILALVQNLAEQSSSTHSKIVYLSCLTEYLDTFIPSRTTKQTTFHLPLEQHIHSKAQLDKTILQPLWITLTQVLESCLSQSPTSDDTLIQKSVVCCETIIAWDFGIEEGTFRRVSFGPTSAVARTDDNDDDDFEDEKQPIWPGSWGTAINEFVVELFFKVYAWLQNASSSLGSKHIRQCLIYLAKLHGPALSSPQERQEHIYSFFSSLETSLSTLSRTSRQIHEPGPHALHLATLTHTLLHELRISSGLGLLCQTPTLLTSITLAWKFVLSSAPYEEGSWYWDASSYLAATWAELLDGLGKMEWDPMARGVVRDLKNQGAELAGMYVAGRLLWAERQAVMEEDEEMDVEIEVKDWETYEEELIHWAGVVRPISSESLNFILETAQSRMEEFSRFDDLDNNHMLYILHEQIHWCLLMTGFFLADEPPAIPYPANHYIATSTLATSIAAQVLTFFDSVADSQNDKWSPQVVQTLYWWFERWGYTYLFVADGDNGGAIGIPGGGDWKAIASWGIARMRKDIEGWSAEKEIVAQIIKTLKTFSRVGRVRHGFLVCENMPEFVQYLISIISDLPQASHSDLVSAIVLLASGAETEQVRNFYMNLLVAPIEKRFDPAFHTTDLTSKEMDRICDGIEMLEGIFYSSHSSTLPMIFRFVMKFLQPIASLLARVNIEGNVAVAVLRLFELLSQKADLTDEWALGEKKRTEAVFGLLLSNYKQWNDDTHGEIDEDEPFVDVCYISDILVNMITGDDQQIGEFTPWSFELYALGLDIILPKMQQENFKIPQPATHFSNLLQRMFEHQTAQLLQLPHERVSSLIQCLVLCIQNPLHEVQEAGFRAILSLALYIRVNSASPTILPLLDTLFTETLAVLFIGGVDSENVSNACAAVHGLASILSGKYETLLRAVLERCEGEKFQRLGRALEKFTYSTRKKFESMGMEMDPEGNVRDMVSAREVEINEQEIWASLEIIWGVLRIR